MFMGIDLSLRSTGLVCIDGDEIKYKLVTPDAKKYNDEELLVYIAKEIYEFIHETNPTHIGLEGLSFGSLSGSKDILAGNFWYVRTMLYKSFPDIKVSIVPVLTWRSKLFSKEERRVLKENNDKLKALKLLMKTAPKEIKKQLALNNEELILNSDIKYVTWKKLPTKIRDEFEKLGFKKGCFDLTDAYMICNFIKIINKG